LILSILVTILQEFSLIKLSDQKIKVHLG